MRQNITNPDISFVTIKDYLRDIYTQNVTEVSAFPVGSRSSSAVPHVFPRNRRAYFLQGLPCPIYAPTGLDILSMEMGRRVVVWVSIRRAFVFSRGVTFVTNRDYESFLKLLKKVLLLVFVIVSHTS